MQPKKAPPKILSKKTPSQVESPPPTRTSRIGGIQIKNKKKEFTGKNLKLLQKEINDYLQKRMSDAQLQRTILLPYTDQNGLEHPQIYEAVFLGRRSNDPNQNVYSGRAIVGKIQFQDSWPTQPPKVYINPLSNGQMFVSVNVYATGEVCHFLINPVNWARKRSTVTQLMQELETLWYEPNFSDAANLALKNQYEDAEDEYWKLQKDQSKFMVSSDVYE